MLKKTQNQVEGISGWRALSHAVNKAGGAGRGNGLHIVLKLSDISNISSGTGTFYLDKRIFENEEILTTYLVLA